jgi:RHS repeat-associated protein
MMTGKVEAFRYDVFGNLVAHLSNTFNTESYFRDEVGNIFAQENKKDRTYGKGGQLQQMQGAQYEYDEEGFLTKKTQKDGNTPLHEWKYDLQDRPQPVIDEWGQVSKDKAEPTENLITWIFDEGSFRPAAKIEGDKKYSIINDYLGTPKEAYDTWGNKIWEIELEAYGKVRSCSGDKSFIPFHFQGQYEDVETGLYYSFRYYAPEEGLYLS